MNFKKFSLILSTLPICAMANEIQQMNTNPASKDYWYAGLGTGVSYIKNTAWGSQNYSFNTLTNLLGSDATDLSRVSAFGQVHGGYHKALGCYFMMGEVFGRTQDGKATGSTQWDNLQVANPGQIRTELTRKYTLGISGKMGMLLYNQKFGIFGSLGLIRSGFKIKRGYYTAGALPNTEASSESNTTAMGLAPGFGMMYYLTEKLPLRLEYTYEIYRTIKAKQFVASYRTNTVPDFPGTFNGNGKVNPRYHTLTLSLSYKF